MFASPRPSPGPERRRPATITLAATRPAAPKSRVRRGENLLRFDHTAFIVDDLDAAADFFVDLGFEREGHTEVQGEIVDRINGLDGVRAEIVMVRTPDGSGRIELAKYHTPVDDHRPHPLPPNRFGLRHICLEVDDLRGIVDRLQAKGFDLVGEVQDYEEYSFRLCYVRGPEGLIVELGQKLAAERGTPPSREP